MGNNRRSHGRGRSHACAKLQSANKSAAETVDQEGSLMRVFFWYGGEFLYWSSTYTMRQCCNVMVMAVARIAHASKPGKCA